MRIPGLGDVLQKYETAYSEKLCIDQVVDDDDDDELLLWYG